jgi:hypothetical protein
VLKWVPGYFDEPPALGGDDGLTGDTGPDGDEELAGDGKPAGDDGQDQQ